MTSSGDSPSLLLQRAAELLEAEAPVVTKPVVEWLREVAASLRDRDVQTYNEERAVDVATAIVAAEGKERSDPSSPSPGISVEEETTGE